MAEGYFTPQDADLMLPKLVDALKHLTQLKEALDQIQESLNISGELSIVEFSRQKRRLNRVVSDLYRQIEEIEELGCVIKDIDTCLVDFPAKMFDREVWLCWRLGEPRVMYWHGKDEGFTSRKSITDDISRMA
ncbi:MAG: DUF2203 domain-containing protein [Nitrososphaerota archaeon]|jgi:hypothetical protein|nr:DUF2203 domain-containing protein [Nitrososphaerota archaeon]